MIVDRVLDGSNKAAKISLVALLILSLIFYDLTTYGPIGTLSNAQNEDNPLEIANLSSADLPDRRAAGRNITLVTGDVVVVTELPSEERSYGIVPADPTNLGQSFQAWKMGNDTYIIPSSVDLRKVDLELFNIDLLIRDGYAEEEYYPVIVECRSVLGSAGQVADAEAQLVKGGGQVSFKSSKLSILAARLPRAKTGGLFKALVELPSTRKIWLDRKVKVELSESVPLIGSPELWDAGYNGSGVTIAILDTGIDDTHPDFYFPNGTSKIIANISFVDYPTTYDPMDYHGHGTHCASTAAGTGVASPIVSNWLTQPVILDGGTTSGEEWSDATPRDLVLLRKRAPGEPVSQYVHPAKCWVKNDNEWIYVLLRIEFPAGEVDIDDGASLCYFWGEYVPPWENSDEGGVDFGNHTFDGYGWDDVQWYDDMEAAPQGQNNTEGKASHDGTFYWFEFRKKLNSGDGYDWSINPGQVVDGHLLLGFGDASANMYCGQYISLKTSSDTITHLDDRFRGVAPGASLYNVKVLNQYGWGLWSWIIAGIEYATYGPDGLPSTGDEADIISMSLAGDPTDGTDPASLAVDAAVDAGVTVVVAAGNDYEYFQISSPGVARKAITVGASDKYDNLADFSSRGPTIDFRVKPDVLAPGVDIVAARAWDTWRPSIPEHMRYCMMSGTSMSTPHVAGAAALMLQKGVPSGWSAPQYVKGALISTAVDLGYDVYTQGGGRVDLSSASRTQVLVDPATVSFGVCAVEALENATVTFYNLNATSGRSLTLDVVVYDIWTGAPVDCASLNVTTLEIAASSNASVLLMIDTTVAKSVYGGKIIADTGTDETIHVVFGFAIMNRLTVEKTKMDGTPASDERILVYKTDSISESDWRMNLHRARSDEYGTVVFYVSDGEYNIWSFGFWEDALVWTVKDRYSVFDDTTALLDERDTLPIAFDENKPDQIFCGLYSLIAYEEQTSFGWDEYWLVTLHYPTNTTTYINPTSINIAHSYEYYPMAYHEYDTPVWHKLFFAEQGVSSSISYVADYTECAQRDSYYRTALVDQEAGRSEFVRSPYFYAPIDMASVWPLNIPQRRLEYVSPDAYYIGGLSDKDPFDLPFWDLFSWHDEYNLGDIVTSEWNGHPFSPYYDIYLDYGEFRLHLRPFGWDSSGRTEIDGILSGGKSYFSIDDRNITWAKVIRNGETILDTASQSNYIDYWTYGEPIPADYTVIVDGFSNQLLSESAHSELSFTYDGISDYSPPEIYNIYVPGLDLYNSRLPGVATVSFSLRDESLMGAVSCEYSLDDGATWIWAPYSVEGNTYTAGLGIDRPPLSNVTVSLRINATDSQGNGISHTILKAFFVKPLREILLSNWLLNPVTFDGTMTSAAEWSEASPHVVRLTANGSIGWPATKNATLWFKNDATWLYILARVPWPSERTDINDGALVTLFWGEYLPPWEHSDLGFLTYGNSTWDAHGWDDATWYSDTEASPPGQNNVEGAASYDGTFYWFEFRKALDSGDGYDWSLPLGDVVGNIRAPQYSPHLMIGIRDSSIDSGYAEYISLQLSHPYTFQLSDFPLPFVVGGVVNSTVIIGTSDPHGPCGAAHTLDTVGGMGITAVLGKYGTVADCRFYLDTDVAWYNETEWKVHYWPVEALTNIITTGGPGVNMITWKYFCNPWYAPVYMYYDGGLGEWVVATPTETYKSSDWIGTAPLSDLIVLEVIYVPEEGRHVLWVGGFGGCATRAGCLALQLFDTGELPFTLEGKAMLVQWIDANGNAKVDPEDTWNVIEIVP